MQVLYRFIIISYYQKAVFSVLTIICRLNLKRQSKVVTEKLQHNVKKPALILLIHFGKQILAIYGISI